MSNKAHTVASFQPLHPSSTNNSPSQPKPEKTAAILAILTALAGHYPRSNMTDGQNRQLLRDMVQDLAEFTVAEIEIATRTYRQGGDKCRFFPRSGELRALIAQARRERAAMASLPAKARPLGRPLRWHDKPKTQWGAGWLESEVPEGELIRDVPGGPHRQPMQYGSAPVSCSSPDLPPDANLDSPAGVMPLPGTRQPRAPFESVQASGVAINETKEAA